MKNLILTGLFGASALLSVSAHAEEPTNKLSCKLSYAVVDAFAVQDLGQSKLRASASKSEVMAMDFKKDESSGATDAIVAKIEKEVTVEGKNLGFYAQSLFQKGATQGALGVAMKEMDTGYSVQGFSKVSYEATKNKGEIIFTIPMDAKNPARLLQLIAVCEVKSAQ